MIEWLNGWMQWNEWMIEIHTGMSWKTDIEWIVETKLDNEMMNECMELNGNEWKWMKWIVPPNLNRISAQ